MHKVPIWIGALGLVLAEAMMLTACAPFVPATVWNDTRIVVQIDGTEKTIRHVNPCHVRAVPLWDDYSIYLYQESLVIPLVRRDGTDIVMIAPRACEKLKLKNPNRDDIAQNRGNFAKYKDYHPLFAKIWDEDPERVRFIFSLVERV